MNSLPCATMSCPKQRPRSSLQCIAEHPQVAAQPPLNEILSTPSAGVWRIPRNWTFVWLGVGCLAPFSVCSLSSAPCSGCLRSRSTSQCSSDPRNKNMMSLLSIRCGALLQSRCCEHSARALNQSPTSLEPASPEGCSQLCSPILLTMQVSSIVSFLKRFTSAQIIFYGHFPDLLLANHSSKLRATYRVPFDRMEASSTAAAHVLLVNSKFTRDTFRDTFPNLRGRTDIRVLYPTVSLPSKEELAKDQASWESGMLQFPCYESEMLCKVAFS